MRPWNETLFVPPWPVKDSVPRVTVRLQEGLLRFFLVWATHLPLTLRPPTCWVKAKLTRACSLRMKEKVVPTGGFFLREKAASLLPSLQVELDWAAFATVGTGSAASPPLTAWAPGGFDRGDHGGVSAGAAVGEDVAFAIADVDVAVGRVGAGELGRPADRSFPEYLGHFFARHRAVGAKVGFFADYE